MKVVIGGNDFNIKSFFSDSGRKQGLRGVRKLEKGRGVALRYKEPAVVTISMREVNIDLGIMFILNNEVKATAIGWNNGDLVKYDGKVDTIIEVNLNELTDIQPGDHVRWIGQKKEDGKIETGELLNKFSDNVMLILDNDGNVQGKLKGRDRIHSRKDTQALYALCVQAERTRSDVDYKKVGRAMVRIIEKQDSKDIS